MALRHNTPSGAQEKFRSAAFAVAPSLCSGSDLQVPQFGASASRW
jgi:hypothetical protein